MGPVIFDYNMRLIQLSVIFDLIWLTTTECIHMSWTKYKLKMLQLIITFFWQSKDQEMGGGSKHEYQRGNNKYNILKRRL